MNVHVGGTNRSHLVLTTWTLFIPAQLSRYGYLNLAPGFTP